MMDKRKAIRKVLDGIPVTHIAALNPITKIAKNGAIVDVSYNGILLHINRQDLLPKTLRQNLTLDSLEGEHLVMLIEPMNLEIDGYVVRTKMIGKGVYEVAIDYSLEAPDYWRECLFDLLPKPGELEE